MVGSRVWVLLPVFALKYDESASYGDTERPMSTDGSHSSPKCSWVADGSGGGAGGWGLSRGWWSEGQKVTHTSHSCAFGTRPHEDSPL